MESRYMAKAALSVGDIMVKVERRASLFHLKAV